MSVDGLSIGQVVISKAGRDKTKFFVVLEKIDSHYVYIVDGDSRKICNPKKKKIKHLQKVNKYINIENIVNDRTNSSDALLRKTLKKNYEF